MIKIENVVVSGWEAAIRGMRNPMNSWDKSDSCFDDCSNCMGVKQNKCITCYAEECDLLGDNDIKLMKSLCSAGSDHRKFMRFIDATCDITAPLYWWKEFDTYKVGTVANSCSTMHKIQAKEFTLDDFSHEHLVVGSRETLCHVIDRLNFWRDEYLRTKSKDDWWQMIQLLPSSYNQRRTVKMNYEVLANMNRVGRRKNHKLDEWREFCRWVDTLPYYKEITEGAR